MENPDTRVQYTKSRFQQAIVELLGEKAIGFVTVKELCGRAGLNRGTFYLHYTEPMDVLHELEKRLYEKIMDGFAPSNEESLTDRLKVMLTDHKVFAAILSRNGDPAFPVRACRLAYERVVHQEASEEKGEQEIPEEFQFIFAGCTWMIGSWLSSSDRIPPEQMARKLLLLSSGVYNSSRKQTEGGRE